MNIKYSVLDYIIYKQLNWCGLVRRMNKKKTPWKKKWNVTFWKKKGKTSKFVHAGSNNWMREKGNISMEWRKKIDSRFQLMLQLRLPVLIFSRMGHFLIDLIFSVMAHSLATILRFATARMRNYHNSGHCVFVDTIENVVLFILILHYNMLY